MSIPAASSVDRHLPLPGTRNVRDVGGYSARDGRVTRWRTLLRADQLDRLTADGEAALLQTGLRQVIDLRWPDELDRSPSVFCDSPAVRYRSVPLLADDPTPHLGLAGMYRHVFDARGAQLAEVVLALLEPDGLPAVIGCAAGKDRTGVTIALLLDLAGVDRSVIVEDYTLSAFHFANPIAHVEPDDWRAGSLVVDCPPELIEEALAHLDREHGGSRALLRRHGLADEQLEAIVDRLTEPARI